MNMFRKKLELTVPFAVILLLKTAWLIFGVVVLCLNLNLKSCSGNIPNFLVAYFTESFYILIEAAASGIKGHRFRKLMGYKRVNQNESSARLVI